jgi:hypothetical protein
MHITVNSAHDVTFEDRHDFSSVKVVIGMSNAHLHDVRVALSSVAILPNRSTAWVSTDALRHWPRMKHDADWQKRFDDMIEKARPQGRFDNASSTIRAHVEWSR